MYRLIFIFWITLLFVGCESSTGERPNDELPARIAELQEGLRVSHSTDTIYASINTKDPDTRGKYQMKFATSVETKVGDLEIVEFGSYLWKSGKWEFTSIYNRPFNSEEFNKWYGADNGKILKGEKYTDADNWLGKSNDLNGKTYKALFYFIGKNDHGQKFVGWKEIVGVMKLKNHE